MLVYCNNSEINKLKYEIVKNKDSIRGNGGCVQHHFICLMNSALTFLQFM